MLLFSIPSTPLFAGMPSLDWSNAASLRLQTLSFFLMGLLVSAGVVRWLWNLLQTDFPRLPRLSYPKALGVVCLWGLLFILVLTMISGARELLTPGAWEKQGWTYALRENSANTEFTNETEVSQANWKTWERRHEHLQRVRGELLQFALKHEGRFPTADEFQRFPETFKHLPNSGPAYYYIPHGGKPDSSAILLHEPATGSPWGLAILADGTIRSYPANEILTLLNAKPETTP
ncbi:MAG: hypothetical protein KDA84_27300 [Planctomycetaceae bacterium]|nr:hypothetical protein [Planctomycetaceae bacterium]